MTEVEPEVQPTGVIENVPLLDLSHATSEDDIAFLKRIQNVAVIIVPEHLATALRRVPMRNVADIMPVVKGGHVRAHTGSLLIGGDAFADPGGENEVLVVAGSLIFTSPVSRIGFKQVCVAGLVLAPRGSESAVGAALTTITGADLYYNLAKDQDFKQFNGQTILSGESLANAGGTPDDLLLANGTLVVTSPVPETGVGFQRIIVNGELVAPRESEPDLARVLACNGQTAWYSGNPRFFYGDESYSYAFFDLLDAGQDLAFVGDVEFEDDVSAEIVREKVSSLTLIGDVKAPKALIPVLQVLATDKYGEISVRQDAES